MIKPAQIGELSELGAEIREMTTMLSSRIAAFEAQVAALPFKYRTELTVEGHVFRLERSGQEWVIYHDSARITDAKVPVKMLFWAHRQKMVDAIVEECRKLRDNLRELDRKTLCGGASTESHLDFSGWQSASFWVSIP